MAPKKQQTQKMSLGDFLQDTSLGNWADELEDMPVAPSVGGNSSGRFGSLDSAGRENRDRYESRQFPNDRREMSSFSRDLEGDSRLPRQVVPLPSQPPYTAHVGNLSFDLTESEVENYFEGCKVISVRIMKDRMDNRPKGFGYVEFADLDSLKKALSLADGQLAGRGVRVSVAEPPKSGGFGADEASQGEWRSGKVLPPIESRNRIGDREPRMARNFSNDSGRPERREMALASSESDVDKWERRGPLPPPESSERRSRTGGFGSRSGSGNFGGPPSRSPPRESAADTGEWRSSKPLAPVVRSDGNSPPPSSPSLGGSPIVQRKKLTLLPRSEHPQEPLSTPVSAVDEVKPKSNPFGAARPVDTDSALKKVEEKLAKEKEHKDDSSVKGAAVTPAPSSPTGPRLDKGRQQPKQLLRRPSASPSAGNTGASRSEIDDVVAAKAEAQDEAISEAVDESWRKPETPVVAAPQEEDAGWETVPSRSKKINGVGARH